MERIYEVWPMKSTVCQQSTSIYCRNFVGCADNINGIDPATALLVNVGRLSKQEPLSFSVGYLVKYIPGLLGC